jgi:anti-sigma factor RsiW
LKRPTGKHIDNDELNALVPGSRETDPELPGLSPEAVREAERHAQSCEDCSKKVAKYLQFLSRFSNVALREAAAPGADCPEDIDWYEVVLGLWPEMKARQLILHAALCDHCGPLLRAAASLDQSATPQEEKLLAELKPPSRPDPVPQPRPWLYRRWLIPAVASILSVAAVVTWWPSPLSGAQFAKFAVGTYQQHAQGNLALDVHADSQQMLNGWFRAKLPFSLALPASPAAPGEDRPFRLEGARLLEVAGKAAVYIAYQMQTGPVGLMVTPDSVAAATGGVRADYRKVTFHYRTVEGYKVVTWSLHGRTYALVSQEGNNTQRSCMVCHSAMRDRDLSQTPTPLPAQPVLQ